MQTIPLYKYTQDNGIITVSPVKPDKDYVEMTRLIADEKKALTKDNLTSFPCVDVQSIDGWREVDISVQNALTLEAALNELGVKTK